MGHEIGPRKGKPAVSHTPADKTRFAKLNAMGCCACRISHGAFVQGEVAHVTVAGRRQGHQATISLCPWHHRAVCMGDLTTTAMERLYGPSFARSKKDFTEAFGSEAELLKHTNDWIGA